MSVQVKCRILRETEQAVQVCQENGTDRPVICWVARSQCDHISKGPVQPDGSRDGVVTMPEWLANVNQLEEED